jgi:hypothetical protein
MRFGAGAENHGRLLHALMPFLRRSGNHVGATGERQSKGNQGKGPTHVRNCPARWLTND